MNAFFYTSEIRPLANVVGFAFGWGGETWASDWSTNAQVWIVLTILRVKRASLLGEFLTGPAIHIIWVETLGIKHVSSKHGSSVAFWFTVVVSGTRRGGADSLSGKPIATCYILAKCFSSFFETIIWVFEHKLLISVTRFRYALLVNLVEYTFNASWVIYASILVNSENFVAVWEWLIERYASFSVLPNAALVHLIACVDIKFRCAGGKYSGDYAGVHCEGTGFSTKGEIFTSQQTADNLGTFYNSILIEFIRKICFRCYTLQFHCGPNTGFT